MGAMKLVAHGLQHLPAIKAALEDGWNGGTPSLLWRIYLS